MPLSPLPGLLEESLDHAVRAWQRRVLVIQQPHFNLRALATMDEAVDRAVVATRFYGQHAKDLLDERLASADEADRDAWRLLRLAHSLQVKSPDAVALAEDYVSDPAGAALVRDAYWYFPVPRSIWEANADHVLPLLKSTSPAVRRLGIEIAGRTDAKATVPTLQAWAEHDELRADCLLALARLGLQQPQHAGTVQSALKSPHPAERAWGLEVAVTLGRPEWLQPLGTLVDRIGGDHTLAWCAWASLHPRQAADAVLTRPSLPPELRLRVAAFTGYADLLIPALAAMAGQTDPLTPFQCDVLYLLLGEVPVEGRLEPTADTDPVAKSRALRSLLLRTCRSAHLPMQNDAHTAPWETAAILHQPEDIRELRIRTAHRLPNGVQRLPDILPDLTHPLRDWLYRERALLSRQPLALAAADTSRRQLEAMAFAALAADADSGMTAHG